MILATAAFAAVAIMAGSGNSGTAWVPPGQAITANVSVSGTYEGIPHVCIHNPGPDAVRTAFNQIRSDHGTQSLGNRYIRAGGTSCQSGRWINVDGARYSLGVVDQRNGGRGSVSFSVSSGLLKVRPTGMVSAVQAAAGGLVADGDWGWLTEHRLQYIRTYWRLMPRTVARVQFALGVGADSVWGNNTEDAFWRLRNASYLLF
jgi:hypothetical protein